MTRKATRTSNYKSTKKQATVSPRSDTSNSSVFDANETTFVDETKDNGLEENDLELVLENLKHKVSKLPSVSTSKANAQVKAKTKKIKQAASEEMEKMLDEARDIALSKKNDVVQIEESVRKDEELTQELESALQSAKQRLERLVSLQAEFGQEVRQYCQRSIHQNRKEEVALRRETMRQETAVKKVKRECVMDVKTLFDSSRISTAMDFLCSKKMFLN